jgi:hypothetical protein
MKEMQIVDGRIDEKSRGFGGDMISYHYWKIDGKKHERLEISDVLDAHVKAGDRIRATYQPGKDNVNRIWAIQLDNEPVRSVVTDPLHCRLPGKAQHPASGSRHLYDFRCLRLLAKQHTPRRISWLVLSVGLDRAQFIRQLPLHD